MSRLAAGRVITAPNQQRNVAKTWAPFWTNFLARITTNPPATATIAVVPPAATLRALEIRPGEYHTRFRSRIAETNGVTKAFTLVFEPNPRASFTPLNKPATVVLLHGYGMMKESMAPWGFVLAQAGFRVVLLDLRGHGESTGATIGFGKYEAADLQQALDQLIARGLCDDLVGVMGLSYGATIALHWAGADPRVRTVVAIAPYDRPEQAIERFIEMQKVPIPSPIVRGAASGAADRLGIRWGDWSAEAAIARMTQPVLLIGGGNDPISRPADIARLRGMAPQGSDRLEISAANHYLIGFWMQDLESPIKNWFHEHLSQAAKF